MVERLSLRSSYVSLNVVKTAPVKPEYSLFGESIQAFAWILILVEDRENGTYVNQSVLVASYRYYHVQPTCVILHEYNGDWSSGL